MSILERAQKFLAGREALGRAKYVWTLDENPAPALSRLRHLKEELGDGLQYVIWAEDEIERLQRENRDLHELADHYRQESLRRGEALEIAEKALQRALEVAFDGPSQPVDSGDHVAWKRGIEHAIRDALSAIAATHEAEQAAPQGEVREHGQNLPELSNGEEV
jgi:hypothetical protein